MFRCIPLMLSSKGFRKQGSPIFFFKYCETEYVSHFCFVPSVHGGVESGVDATEPYSSARKQTQFYINLRVNMQ